MKKFFTLIACALVAGSAFAQSYLDPADEITNGNIAYNIKIKGGDFSQYPTSKLENFVSKEWLDKDNNNNSPARVTVDPKDADDFAALLLDEEAQADDFMAINYCLVVSTRNASDALAAGNATVTNNQPLAEDFSNWASWDSQFFIAAPKVLKEGDKVKLKMRVKADTPATVGTQAHGAPGAYNHWQMFGDVSFTEEWADYESDEVTLSGDQAKNGGFQSVAFNLAGVEANNFYFDDIELIVTRQEEITADAEMYDKTIPEGFEEITVNGDFEGEGLDNYVAHDWIEGVKQEFVEPRVIADPNGSENKCIVITTPASPANAWAAQFFVTDPKHHFYKGDIVRLRMRVKADATQSAEAQQHAGPGSYLSSNFANAKFQEKFWVNFDTGEKEVTNASFQTIAFNLSTLAAGNNVYIDDVQLIVKRADPTAAAKSDLETAIAKGQSASTFQKTDESLLALEGAISDGEDVLADDEATKAELEAAAADIDAAFAGLAYVEGYTPLSADMFMDYTDPANPVPTKCLYKTYESVDCTYGDGQAPAAKYADVSDFDELVLVCGDNTAPRIIINSDLGDDAIDITVGEESPYLLTLEDPQYGYVIDLAAIVQEQGYAHLNAIRKPGNDAGITAVDMVLGKGTATSIKSFNREKAPAKVIFNLAGQQIKSLQKGLNIVDGKKVLVK